MNEQLIEESITRFMRDLAFVVLGMLLGALAAALGIGYGLGIF